MTYYNMAISYGVDGGRVDSIESTNGKWAKRDYAEQLEHARDEFERKLRELCQAHGALLIKFHDAAKDAVWAAKLAQQAIYELYNRKPAHMRDYGYVASQAIIERYEGGQG